MIVTGAVQVYLHQPPLGSGNAPLHEVGCAVKAPIVVFVPARVSAEGVMLVKLATVLLVTVMTMRKLIPAAIAEVATPEVSVVWKPVICSDCRIHEVPAGALMVLVPALVKLVLAVKVARASRRVSVRSCVLFPAVTTTLKLREDPTGIASFHVAAV